MRPKRNLIVFSILLAGMLLYYFQQAPVVKKQFHPANTSPSQINDKTNVASTNNKIKPDPIEKLSEFTNDIENDAKSNTVIEADYITAYRDWQYFENCYTDIEDFGNDKDPLITLKERFNNNWRESQTEPTSQQNMYYQHHVDICKTLINDVGGDEDDYNQIIYNLYQRFVSITPKSVEENQLNQALKLREQLDTLKVNYSHAHYRKSNLSIEEQSSLNLLIKQLTLSLMRIYDGNNELLPEQIIAIKQYSDDIEELKNKLTRSKVVDPEKIKLAEQNINAHLNSMDIFLLSVKSPDAFLIIAGELFKPEYLQQDSDVMRHLKSQTQIFDNYYIGILNNIIHPLIACSMDYPCDAESDLILSYCLGLKDSMFNQACGQGLEDFYFNFYIGANQLDDVNKYFNYLVTRYAN